MSAVVLPLGQSLYEQMRAMDPDGSGPGEGAFATGSPDAFTLDTRGNRVPGPWAEGMDPAAVDRVLASELEVPWIGTSSGALVPPSSPAARSAELGALVRKYWWLGVVAFVALSR